MKRGREGRESGEGSEEEGRLHHGCWGVWTSLYATFVDVSRRFGV